MTIQIRLKQYLQEKVFEELRIKKLKIEVVDYEG